MYFETNFWETIDYHPEAVAADAADGHQLAGGPRQWRLITLVAALVALLAGSALAGETTLLNVSYDPRASSIRTTTRPSPSTGRRRPATRFRSASPTAARASRRGR